MSTQSNNDSYDDLHQSYGRCLQSGGFIERFYDIFLESHPEVATAFANTDFHRQRRLLRRSLTNSIMYAAGSDIVSSEVHGMAEAHSRHGRAPVPPQLYGYWLKSLMIAIREHDPQINPVLESRWEKALGHVIHHFKDAY